MAVETLSNITQDEVEYARMTTLIKSELDYRSEMKYERDSGRQEGREEDRKYVLELLEQGLSTEEIKARLQQN